MKLAVVGGGWAGLAAAVAAARGGYQVTLLEASRGFGGRARALPVMLPDGTQATLDNGQHILIGAYRETLALMRQVGIDPARVLQRLPLTLRFPDGSGLALPDWPTPLDAGWGILRASGWRPREKFALLRRAATWQLAGFHCDPQASVADLCDGLPARVMADLVDPLCVAALNTPATRASGAVFLRVLRDGLFGPPVDRWNASNLLLPRVDLGRALPDAAVAWLRAQGAQVRDAARVQAISPGPSGWHVDGEPFDAVVLACPPWEAQRLVQGAGIAAEGWLHDVAGLSHEAIATVYTVGGPALPGPMIALRSTREAPAQFVFDRGHLGGPAGVLAFVVSASERDAAGIEAQVLAQAAALGWRVQPLRTIVEKRATFACTPGLRRPPVRVAPGLVACGDYVEGPYPATLEGAVRAAHAAVQALSPGAAPAR